MASGAVGLPADAAPRDRPIALEPPASQRSDPSAPALAQGAVDGGLDELAKRRHAAQTALVEVTTRRDADEGRSSPSLPQSDEPLASDLADLNARAGVDQDATLAADPNAEQGAKVSREQAELDPSAPRPLSVDQDVVATLQPRREDVQTPLDALNRIDGEPQTAPMSDDALDDALGRGAKRYTSPPADKPRPELGLWARELLALAEELGVLARR